VLPAAVAWGMAIIYATSALEKIISPHLRGRFLAAWGEFMPRLPAVLATGAAVIFLFLEAAVLPLMIWAAKAGLALALALTAAVTFYALVQWRRGAHMGECPCGGLWAASGRNLLLRNLVLSALALYAWRWAPAPVPLQALPYTLGGIFVLLFIGGFAEALRVKFRTR